MNEQKRYYRFLNIVRLFCALLIIFIHMGLREDHAIVPCLADQGVPFFFLVSGFFFAKKVNTSTDIKQTTVSYIKPILTVYFVWVLLWMPSAVIQYRDMYSGSLLFLSAVLVRRFILAGFAPYWYLLVLAEGAVLLALIIKYNYRLLGWMFFAAGIVLSIIYQIQSVNNPSGFIYKAFYFAFSWTNNVIMKGFPLMYLGYILNLHEARIHKLSFWFLLFLYASSVFSAFFLFQSSRELYYIPLGMIQAILLFLICLSSVPMQEQISLKTCTHARNLSSVVFLTHTVFLAIIGHGFHLWNLGSRYILTVLCAAILYLLVVRLNCKPLNKLLMIK